MIARLVYGETSFLFMGDAEPETERLLLSRGLDLSADVLKVSHHGSAHASTRAFLEQVRRKVALRPADALQVLPGRFDAFGCEYVLIGNWDAEQRVIFAAGTARIGGAGGIERQFGGHYKERADLSIHCCDAIEVCLCQLH